MSEIERYNGLTTADKPALMDAKENGADWIARDENGMLCGYATKPSKCNSTREWYTDDGFELITKFLEFVKWSDAEPVNIDLALAQIAEMESNTEHTERYGEILADIENWPVWKREAFNSLATSKHATQLDLTDKPLTWNERINQMTLEEKAIWLYNMDVCRVSSISIEECNSFRHCVECMKSMLASPYTEGGHR